MALEGAKVAVADDPMDMGDVELRLEQQSRTCTEQLPTTAWMQDDCTDVGGRATQGAVAEVEHQK